MRERLLTTTLLMLGVLAYVGLMVLTGITLRQPASEQVFALYCVESAAVP